MKLLNIQVHPSASVNKWRNYDMGRRVPWETMQKMKHSSGGNREVLWKRETPTGLGRYMQP